MFYDTRLLSKTGRLGEIWLIANHHQKLDSKIVKIVLETDIHRTIQTIMESNLPPLSLRLYAYLLHGVIKLYHHKVSRLYEDSSKALSSINAYRSQKETTTKKAQSKKDASSTALTMKDRYNINLDLTIPDIAGLDIMEEMDLMQDINIAPHTAITFGDVEDSLIDDSEVDFSTPSAQDYLGDFDPHHPSIGEIDETIGEVEEQPGDTTTTSDIGMPPLETTVDESAVIGDDMQVEQPSQIQDIFEAEFPSSQVDITIDDEAQKNADLQDLESYKPTARTVVIRPDKTSLLSQRKLQGNLEDQSNLIREIEPTPSKRRKLQHEENLEDLFALPNLPFESNLNSALLDLFRSSVDHVEPFENLQKITEEEEIEAARRASSINSPIEEPDHAFEPPEIDFEPIQHDDVSLINEPEQTEPEETEPEEQRKSRRTLSIQHARRDETPQQPKLKKKKIIDERFESIRTQSVHSYVGKLFKKSGEEKIGFSEHLNKKSKSTVSQIFYELLVLKSLNIVELEQTAPEKFTEVYISKLATFDHE